jgi:Ser/Thr protein kinase RdoA (MazF antagonist)
LVHQAEDFDLRQVLERYSAPYHADTRHSPLPARGFSGASIWRIETEAGPFALRALGAESVDRSRLAGLHRLVTHIRKCGVTQVPVPLAAIDGATFFEAGQTIWQLEPWLPGVADFHARPSELRLVAAMTCLALWHRAAAGFAPLDAGRQWFFTSRSGTSPGLAERAREISRWNRETCELVRQRLESSPWKEFGELGRKVLDQFVQVGPRIAARLNLGLGSKVPLQPCLRDIWHDHVLFTGNEVTGMIDPHAARSDSVATDLARLLGSLVGDDRVAWEAGLNAYQQVRPLALEELALVELFDQSAVLLSGLTWLDWVCLQGRAFDDRVKVAARLRTIVERLEVLASK